MRLKDCSSITTGATTPSSSSVKRTVNVSSGVILENGNGQYQKPSPALPSPAGNGKRVDLCHNGGSRAESFRGMIMHWHVGDIKRSEQFRDDSGSESSTPYSEGRRISVRQTELAYRFKEIVVRKMSGYMHVSLVSHTRAKNAVNPKVSNSYVCHMVPCFFLLRMLFFYFGLFVGLSAVSRITLKVMGEVLGRNQD